MPQLTEILGIKGADYGDILALQGMAGHGKLLLIFPYEGLGIDTSLGLGRLPAVQFLVIATSPVLVARRQANLVFHQETLQLLVGGLKGEVTVLVTIHILMHESSRTHHALLGSMVLTEDPQAVMAQCRRKDTVPRHGVAKKQTVGIKDGIAKAIAFDDFLQAGNIAHGRKPESIGNQAEELAVRMETGLHLGIHRLRKVDVVREEGGGGGGGHQLDTAPVGIIPEGCQQVTFVDVYEVILALAHPFQLCLHQREQGIGLIQPLQLVLTQQNQLVQPADVLLLNRIV